MQDMAGLDTLIREEGPGISIILPIAQSEERKIYEALKKATQRARGILKDKSYPDEIKNLLNRKLDDSTRVLPHDLPGGLGIFVSTSQSAVIKFPFPVRQKITVGNSFETRDLLYLRQYSEPYYVLTISNREVRLYSGVMDKFHEVSDVNLPMFVDDQYEYLLPPVENPATSITATKRNGRNLAALHITTMLKDSDVHLKPYLSKDDAKVILVGPQKITGTFLALTRYANKVIGKVPRGFSDMNIDVVKQSAWLSYMHHKKEECERYVLQLIENNGGYLTDGLRDAWTEALAGKGHLLAVEKDYHCPGYQLPNDHALLLQPPPKPYTVIPDAVSVLIETVSKKNGKIIFMDNGQLRNLGHVVLFSRY